MAQALRLGIDPRLLRELPRMFHSFEEAVTELIQNAYRAGARKVEIVLDHDSREVTVRDDGPGAPDPDPLLHAGRSGWGEHVIEPAGLGLFALLGLSEHVTIESRFGDGQAWRLELGQDAFDGAPVRKEDLTAAGEPTGLTIRARLGERADLSLQREDPDGITFRHAYPVHVTLTEIRGGEPETEELPVPEWPADSVDTPVGRFAVWRRRGLDSTRLYVLWEHRFLNLTNVWPDLKRALKMLPDGKYVVNALRGATLVWAVDVASGVRPKLPDRREVIRDSAYLQAVEALAAVLVTIFDREGLRRQVEALNLPPVIEKPHRVREQLASVQYAPIFDVDLEALLEIGGYVECRWTLWDAWEEEHDDGLAGVEFYYDSAWVRNPLRVRNQAVAEAMSRQGVWAAYDPEDGVEVAVVAEGVRWADGNGRGLPQIGLCRRLEVVRADSGEVLASLDLLPVADAKDLSLRVDPARPEGNWPPGLCLWWAEPDEALAALWRKGGRGREVLGFVLDQAQESGRLWDWAFWDDGDECLDEEAARRDLVAHLAEQLTPERAREEQRFADLEALEEDFGRFRREAGILLNRLERIRKLYPEVAELEALERLVRKTLDDLHLDLAPYRPASMAGVS